MTAIKTSLIAVAEFAATRTPPRFQTISVPAANSNAPARARNLGNFVDYCHKNLLLWYLWCVNILRKAGIFWANFF
jgi:hypothetical protein